MSLAREPGMLFVGGPQRSGTSAVVDYLNRHPEVLLCMERYKWVPPREVCPELFTFERILDYRMSPRGEGREETNTPREYHEKLLASKDAGRLKWIGDKNPNYVRKLDRLSENNPGASFILIYRPLEEVAESFEARSRDTEDPWLLGGFEDGVDYWNAAMRSTRDFIEDAMNLNVLILDYRDFFSGDGTVIPLLSRFLDLEMYPDLLNTWEEMSRGFEAGRRPKKPLGDEQRAYVDANRDGEAERWVLDRIETQRREIDLYPPEVARSLNEERRRSALKISRLRARNIQLNRRNRNLAQKLHTAISPGDRPLLDGVDRIKQKFLRPPEK